MTLQWSNPDKVMVVLEQSENEAFEPFVVRYEGFDGSSVLSGLAEGSHHFRIGPAEASDRSRPLAVEVKFFPRDQLAWLLGIGGLVVTFTITTIIAGAVRNREKEAG